MSVWVTGSDLISLKRYLNVMTKTFGECINEKSKFSKNKERKKKQKREELKGKLDC